jgi:hypothetical protein
MASSSVKEKNRLEGASNFNPWKARVFNILEEGDLDDLVTRVMEEPTSNEGRETYKNRQAKISRELCFLGTQFFFKILMSCFKIMLSFINTLISMEFKRQKQYIN